jgi:hypothetical protein
MAFSIYIVSAGIPHRCPGREWRKFMAGKREEQLKEITERLEHG